MQKDFENILADIQAEAASAIGYTIDTETGEVIYDDMPADYGSKLPFGKPA